jgi:hypothetical protein
LERVWVIVCALAFAFPLGAQQPTADEVLAWSEVPCSSPEGRTVRGLVRDQLGSPITWAQIVFPRLECGVQTDSLGIFVARDLPRLPIEMHVLAFGRGRVDRPVATSRDTVIDVVFNVAPPRIRDWQAYPGRPSPPSDVDGIAGCYWMGHALPRYSREFRLFEDGRVGSDGQLVNEFWRLSDDEQRLEVAFLWMPGHAWTRIEIDLSEDPIDWSSLPALFVRVSDAALFQTSEWDSFVSRIECAGSDSP